MIVFIGMETSGALRRRFQALGHETYSCDTLPSEDGGEEMAFRDGLPIGRHLQGDVFAELENMWANDLWPELAIFHPTCTYLTNSAEWAYKDPDFARYPGVGYHQQLRPGTLFGQWRRSAREDALKDVRRIMGLSIRLKVIENPIGAISRIMDPTQILQPYDFGDDASKATCLWILDKHGTGMNSLALPKDPAKRVKGRMVTDACGNVRERWANQTDGGQNRLSPGDDRWKDRSRTYPGIADALAQHFHNVMTSEIGARSLI